MRKNFLKVLIFLATCGILESSTYANTLTDNQDKIAHAVTSFTISHVTYVICDNHFDELTDNECLGVALLVSFTAGMIKESIIDSKPSIGDTIANNIGIGLSIPLLVWEY